MADPTHKSAPHAEADGAAPDTSAPASAPQTIAAPGHSIAETGADFPEAATETIAALLNLIRLMGAELVLNGAGGETERFERAVRAKIEQYSSPTRNQAARQSGLAFARYLVEQVITQIRAQAQVKKSLGKGQSGPQDAARADTIKDPALRKFLN
jgi:hypothetical protein